MSNYKNHISSEEVYLKLKEDILSLKLKPGQMISENEIANIYNVSRTPIKTAFLRLKGEKYIEIIPQKGSFVTLLDMKYIKDIIYMRAILEIDMLTNIINEGLTNTVVSILKRNLEEQYSLINSNEITPTAFYQVDSAFHFTFFTTLQREKMWEVIQDCQVYYTRFRILDTLTTARYISLYNEHENLLELIKVEDVHQIKKCLHDHLHGNLRTLAPKIKGEYKEYFIN